MLPENTNIAAVMYAKTGSLIVLTETEAQPGSNFSFNVYLTMPLEANTYEGTSALHQGFETLTGVTRLYLPQQGSSIKAERFDIDIESVRVARSADYFSAHLTCRHPEFGFQASLVFDQLFGNLDGQPTLTLSPELFDYRLDEHGDLMVTFK